MKTLKLSIIRNFYKIWKECGGDTRYDEWFQGKHRIYIDLLNVASKKIIISEIQKTITAELEKIGYTLKDYSTGIANKPNNKNNYKIGRLLQKINPTLKNLYDSDILREGTKVNKTGMKVVISRHPLDIITMTYGRGWSSCMDITEGHNRKYVTEDIKEGTIIAYLIKENDLDIKKPIGRVLLKPFTNNTTTYLALERVYGTNMTGFIETVEQWLNQRQTTKKGIYLLNKKLYNDGKPSVLLGYDKKYILTNMGNEYGLIYNTNDIGSYGNKCGVINKNGDIVIEPIYNSGNFDHKYNIFYYTDNSNINRGVIFISNDSKILKILKPKYQNLNAISENLFITSKKNQLGVVDINYNIIIEFKYSNIYKATENILILTYQNNEIIIYDIKNRSILLTVKSHLQYPYVISDSPLLLCLLCYSKNTNKIIINEKGETIFICSCYYHIYKLLKDSKFIVRKDNNTSAIYDFEKNKYITEFVYYNFVKENDNTYRCFNMKNEIVYLDSEGKPIKNHIKEPLSI